MFWGLFQDAENKELHNHPAVIEMSKGEMFLAACMNIFRTKYGFVESTNEGMAKNAAGQFIPLYTYPAFEYIDQFDYSQLAVFEYGSGASTFYWMNRAKQVVSIENNQMWYARLKPQLATNVEYVFAQDDDFPAALEKYEQKFDVIVVDGAGYRYDCAKLALSKLKSGGMIILDNSDWHPNTAAMLKDAGLLQIDMSGFKATESHTSTTSLFLDRTFNFPIRSERQPALAMGAKAIHSDLWDQPSKR